MFKLLKKTFDQALFAAEEVEHNIKAAAGQLDKEVNLHKSTQSSVSPTRAADSADNLLQPEMPSTIRSSVF